MFSQAAGIPVYARRRRMTLIATRQCFCCISEAAIASSASACLLSLSVHPGEVPYIVITARPMLVLSLAIKSALIMAATARSASVFAAPSALSTNFCVSGGATTSPPSRNIVPLQCLIARVASRPASAKLALMFTGGSIPCCAARAHALMARKRPKNKSLRTIFFQKMRIKVAQL